MGEDLRILGGVMVDFIGFGGEIFVFICFETLVFKLVTTSST